jgi:hypothetical protein
MRNGIVLTVIGIFAAAAGADPIRYDQIPADAVSYFSSDIDRLLSSRLSQIKVNGVDLRANQSPPFVVNGIGGPLASMTMYSVGNQGSPVLLLHASAQKFHRGVEGPRSTDTVVFAYDRQEVHYSSSCLMPEMFGKPSKSDAPAQESRGYFGVGLGGDYRRSWNGSFYTAYVGPDLIVTALDLHAMAGALDVLNGKKPSLAKEDPHGLKTEAPPGVIIIGAGLSANWAGGNLAGHDNLSDERAGATTRPVTVADSDFGMDLFGSFKGKARIARFDMGENEQNEYADATFTMIDPDSAGQLKNLLLGVKALVSLSQSQQRPLIDPLEIDAAGNDVALHWSMPTTKLSELIRLAAQAQTHDSSLPTNVPATQPAH